VLRRVADEQIEFCHQAIEHLRRSARGSGRDCAQQTGFTVFILTRVFSLNQSIGKNDEPISGGESYTLRFVLGFRLNAERQAADVQALDQSIGAAQNRIIVSGV
jgi:hypothetical protein